MIDILRPSAPPSPGGTRLAGSQRRHSGAHEVVNGGVMACTFAEPNDEKALGTLPNAYPGRKVVGIEARELLPAAAVSTASPSSNPLPPKERA